MGLLPNDHSGVPPPLVEPATQKQAMIALHLLYTTLVWYRAQVEAALGEPRRHLYRQHLQQLHQRRQPPQRDEEEEDPARLPYHLTRRL